MLYRLFRPLLFAMPEELSHELVIDSLAAAGRLRLTRRFRKSSYCPRRVMGLLFSNPVGLAAGFDKNARALDGLGGLGFGFIEAGTVTPRPQEGNSTPRLFRLDEYRALINSMGCNNQGVAAIAPRLARRRYDGVLGVSIGINKTTPLASAADDFVTCLDRVYSHAHYVAFNLSSPNTDGVRDLQHGEILDRLLLAMSAARVRLAEQHGQHKPIAVKISPDLETDALTALVDKLLAAGVEGIIATNTTVSREGIEDSCGMGRAGGLSGAPLHERSLRVIRHIRKTAGNAMAIVGSGGILHPDDAWETLNAGADLIQLYTGLVYHGPRLPFDIVREIDRRTRALPSPAEGD